MRKNYGQAIVKMLSKWYHELYRATNVRQKGVSKMCKIFNPLLIANNFIERGITEGYDISPMKLQKLMYFLYRDYLNTTGDPLFSERFETWQYGPVLSQVYHAFKGYGASSIKKYYIDSDGNALKVNEGNNPEFARILDRVWERYKNYNGIQLSELTHKNHTAWYKAWNNDLIFLTDEDIGAEAEDEVVNG